MDRFVIEACALSAIGALVASQPDARVTVEQGGETGLYRVSVTDGSGRDETTHDYLVVVGAGPRGDGTYGAVATVAAR